jgi:hypothetical protein
VPAQQPQHQLDSTRSLQLALGQLDEALTPELAGQLADATLRVTLGLASIARAGGQRLSASCEVLAQLHDVITGQAPAA